MCETKRISRSITRLGRHSFNQRLNIVSPLYVDKEGDIEKLLNEVGLLSKELHEAFPTISENDYKVFGPELRVVIDTLKSLRKDSLSRVELKSYNDRLRQQIAELEELDHDIKVFRIDAPKNKELNLAMQAVNNLNLSKYAK